jgi:hypothetical protein
MAYLILESNASLQILAIIIIATSPLRVALAQRLACETIKETAITDAPVRSTYSIINARKANAEHLALLMLIATTIIQ